MILITISCLWGRPIFRHQEFNVKNVLMGIFSALFLYFIFFIGKKMLPFFIPTHAENLGAVYGNIGSTPIALVGALLFFPIGFGEELFWRGYIQKSFMKKFGGF